MIYENLVVTGSLKVTSGLVGVPKNTKANRPGSPTSGSLFFQQSPSSSLLYVYTGIPNNDSGWEAVGNQAAPYNSFKYRHIINYGYVAGGYKDASPWKNVHKAVYATDQTSHLGQLMDYPANYTKGACSKTILWVFSSNTGNGFTGPSTVSDTYNTAVNMVTETGYTHQTKWDITTARADCGVMFQETEFAFIFGGYASTVDVFNMTTEICLTGQGLSSVGGSETSTAFSDENSGYGYTDSVGIKMNYANRTFTSTTQWGAHGQQKGISSKNGKGYAGNEGSYNGGYNLRRWQFSTDTNAGNVTKPETNTGEENFTMGQDWQYMLGNYNGVQNNNNWKFYYATDSGTAGVSGLSPTAQAGQSSAICGWRQ